MDQSVSSLAYILHGEAGTCPAVAMVAIAWMLSRQPGQAWYGWQTPGEQAMAVAGVWYMLPDPTPGANFMFSGKDLQLASVQSLIEKYRQEELLAVQCARDSLHFFGGQGQQAAAVYIMQ